MGIIILAITGWLIVATIAGVVIGKAINRADRWL